MNGKHDFATSIMCVVAIIRLEQLLSGKAHLIVSHACVDHISSMRMRYLQISRYFQSIAIKRFSLKTKMWH
jgi:hypothetical protein